MIFKILLELNKKQKVEFYKLGMASKFIAKEVSKLLLENYKRNIYLTHDDILLRLSSLNLVELKSYNVKIFSPVIYNVLLKFRKLKNKEDILKVKYQNNLAYKVYFNDEDISFDSDMAIIKKTGYLPNLTLDSNYFLKFKHTYTYLTHWNLEDITLSFDGYNFYLEGYVRSKVKNDIGIRVLFSEKYFLETSNGIKISKLSDDSGFINKCKVILDLESKLNSRHVENIYEAEINSLVFTENYIEKTINTYVKECVKMILNFHPDNVSVKTYSTYNKLGLKEKINIYITQQTKKLLYKECKKRNIEYIIEDNIKHKLDFNQKKFDIN